MLLIQFLAGLLLVNARTQKFCLKVLCNTVRLLYITLFSKYFYRGLVYYCFSRRTTLFIHRYLSMYIDDAPCLRQLFVSVTSCCFVASKFTGIADAPLRAELPLGGQQTFYSDRTTCMNATS
jgi:hypothetical protein